MCATGGTRDQRKDGGKTAATTPKNAVHVNRQEGQRAATHGTKANDQADSEARGWEVGREMGERGD